MNNLRNKGLKANRSSNKALALFLICCLIPACSNGIWQKQNANLMSTSPADTPVDSHISKIIISVVDENNAAVPFAIVGGVSLYKPRQPKKFFADEKLIKSVARDPSTWEFAAASQITRSFSHQEWSGALTYLGMTNENGELEIEESRRELVDLAPDDMRRTFSIYKRGYQYEVVTASVNLSQPSLNIKIMLKKNITTMTPDYYLYALYMAQAAAQWDMTELPKKKYYATSSFNSSLSAEQGDTKVEEDLFLAKINKETARRYSQAQALVQLVVKQAQERNDRHGMCVLAFWSAYLPFIDISPLNIPNGKLEYEPDLATHRMRTLQSVAMYCANYTAIQAIYLLEKLQHFDGYTANKYGVLLPAWASNSSQPNLKFYEHYYREWANEAATLQKKSETVLWPAFQEELTRVRQYE